MNRRFVENFSLGHTLESGQHFRYERVGDWYYVVTRNTIIKIRQEGDLLFFDGASDKLVADFFALDEPYEKILASINRDEVISGAIMECLGMRIMRQDPWECAVSFVLSSNSNIPRIKKNINDICRVHGEPIEFDGHHTYSFPAPQALAKSKKLGKLALGYREPYVRELAKRIAAQPLTHLKKMPFEQALDEIIKLPGVGDKVGQCVLLFSLGHGKAFPVDVWIEKAMKTLYNLDESLSGKHIQALGRTYFGAHAGYAQQFIYHYARSNKHLFTERKSTTHERDNRRKAAAFF